MKTTAFVLALIFVAGQTVAEITPPPAGYWPLSKSREIVEATQTVRLAPDLSHLSTGENKAVARLLEVGKIFQTLYEDSRHPQAVSSLRALQAQHRKLGSPRETSNLLDLYRLNQGPIATTLRNQREPFLPVHPVAPGKNVYPDGVTKEEIEAFLQRHPEERGQILDARTVVRRANARSAQKDLGALTRYPVLDTLHPGLRSKLEKVSASGKPGNFYAIPYSVAWADSLMQAYGLLNEAAAAVESDDHEFARYLRNRARDLLSNDYESGDASWVTGRFRNLNAQIGAYEVYDDELFGVKAFFAVSVLLRNQKESDGLRQAIKGLQQLENSLPYEQHKTVREDIPVGVYDVIADFGQARGSNTATILPNDSLLARRYGRTILLRANIMRDPELFSNTNRAWEAAMAARFDADLKPDGDFYRTLWHEIGHYLGVDTDKQGRDLDTALQENSSTMEEMKADLVSLFVAPALHTSGYYDDSRLRSVYAAGIRRVLQNTKPRRDQPYQTMQLMQWNYFLESGLLAFDRDSAELVVHYERYPDVVRKLLTEVLALQYSGDKAASDRFIDKYTTWSPDLHEKVAARIRAQQKYRFRLMRYAALGE